MENYVVGFLFDEDYEEVVLIRKNRPDWQAGLLNGVGGKIEEGEDPEEAMRREFEEEAGKDHKKWDLFSHLSVKGTDIDLWFFSGVGIENVETQTDEEIEIREVDNIRYLETIPNLDWLVPMAMKTRKDNSIYRIHADL